MRRSILTGLMLAVLVSMAGASTTYVIYRVQPGDTLDSVARSCNSTVAELRALNQQVREPLALHEVLTVPLREGAPLAAGQAANSGTGAASSALGANGVDTTGSVVASAGSKVLGADGQVEGAPAAGPAAPAVAEAQAPAAAQRLSYAVNGALGRLGQVSGAQVPIYRDRQHGGTKMYTASAGTSLLVVSRVDGWYGIRMLDGSIGWAECDFVKLTDTELLPAPGAQAAPTRGVAIIQTAYSYLGVPYVWGGESKRGIDCSGLVLRAYGAHGVNLPRTAREQIGVGQSVPLNQLQPGDRIYFSSGGSYIDHTGMYIGDGKFIHASGRRRQVCIDNLFDPRYMKIYQGARR